MTPTAAYHRSYEYRLDRAATLLFGEEWQTPLSHLTDIDVMICNDVAESAWAGAHSPHAEAVWMKFNAVLIALCERMATSPGEPTCQRPSAIT